MEDDGGDTMATEFPPPSPSPAKLIEALDQATQSAKQLAAGGTAVNSDQHRLIISSLHSAQLSLSNFLSLHRHSPAEISVSSAGADDLMIDDDEQSSMERVEEKMRESLHIQNKRRKRPLSPLAAAVAERWGMEERKSVRVPAEFDPRRTWSRNLELVYQFHGRFSNQDRSPTKMKGLAGNHPAVYTPTCDKASGGKQNCKKSLN